MEQTSRDTYRLSTGMTLRAERGFIGINGAGTISAGREVFGGQAFELLVNPKSWAPKERQELAAYMVEQWQAWANQQ